MRLRNSPDIYFISSLVCVYQWVNIESNILHFLSKVLSLSTVLHLNFREICDKHEKSLPFMSSLLLLKVLMLYNCFLVSVHLDVLDAAHEMKRDAAAFNLLLPRG